MRRRAVAIVVVLYIVIAAPAALARVTVGDGNDTRGPLDIDRVYQSGTDKPLWRILTQQRWRAAQVFDRGFALVYLDTFGDDRYDYYALVRSDGSRMKGRLYRDLVRKRDRKVAFLEVWRRDRRSVSVRVPLAKMIVPEDRDEYVWYAQTLASGPRCRRVCMDRAPNDRGVERPIDAPARRDLG